MKIGIIVGSVREQRLGYQVGTWVLENAQGRSATYELVDLKEFRLPLLESPTPPGAANGEYADPVVQEWAAKIKEFDAYIFVTPEYNHAVPGAMKNAFDSLGVEWIKKAVAFVSYGADNGVRATENWRVAVANYNMYDVRETVALGLFTDFVEGTLEPLDRRAEEVSGMLASLEAAAEAMNTLR